MRPYQRMKRFIDEHHLKQSSIADDMGISVSTLSMMLNGKRQISVDTLEKFCKVVKARPELFFSFNVNQEELFEDVETEA